MYQNAISEASDYKILLFVAPTFIILTIISAIISKKRSGEMVTTTTMLALSGIFMVPLFTFIGVDFNVQENNIVAHGENLKKKYAIDSIDYSQSDFSFQLEGTNQVVFSVDDRQYIFQSKQDPKTSEPTLLPMPIPGGIPEKGDILMPEDLLRN